MPIVVALVLAIAFAPDTVRLQADTRGDAALRGTVRDQVTNALHGMAEEFRGLESTGDLVWSARVSDIAFSNSDFGFGLPSASGFRISCFLRRTHLGRFPNQWHPIGQRFGDFGHFGDGSIQFGEIFVHIPG